MRTYIASPFFNDVQISQVEAIEKLLKNLDDEFYSPRLHGNFSELNLNEKMSTLAKSLIFTDNIYQLNLCNRIIVNIDGHRDIGTLFELGVSIGFNKKINLLIDDDSDILNEYPDITNAITQIEFNLKSNSSILQTLNYLINLNNSKFNDELKVVVNTTESDSYPAGIILLGYFYAKRVHVSYISDFVSKSNLMISESGIKQYKSKDDFNNGKFVDYSKMEIQ